MSPETVTRPAPLAAPSGSHRGRAIGRLMRDYGLSLLVFVLLVGIWEAVSRGGLVAVYILPAPDLVISQLVDDWSSVLSSATWVTGQEMLIGFVLAVAAGLAIAVALHWSAILRRAIYPLLVASQAIPIVVLAPLLAIIIGYNIGSKLVVVLLVCFFPIVVNTLDGLTGVDAEYVRMMRTLHGTRWLTFRRIELPSAMPSFFSGARVAAAFAPVGAVFGEYAGSSNGLGFVMIQAGPELQTARVLAAVLLLTIMAVLLVLAVTACERILAPWARNPRRNT